MTEQELAAMKARIEYYSRQAESIASDVLVCQGGEVKALGDGKVGGYLVRFSTEKDPDQSQFRDFFTKDTAFGPHTSSTVLYHHALDPTIGRRMLSAGTLKTDEVGVWIDAQLKIRDEYEAAIYNLAKAGKLGWSSGTASHLVDREPVRNAEGKTIAHRVLAWPLGVDASLTPNPAEPRCEVVALKSLGDVTPFSTLFDSFKQLSTADDLVPGSVADHSRQVVSAVRELASRFDDRIEARVKAGRVLSQANLDELTSLHGEMQGLMERLQGLMEKARPKDDTAPDDVEKLRTQMIRRRATLTGALGQ